MIGHATSQQEEQMSSDEALAAALADDLDTAFETLAQAWGRRLYAFALRMTGRPRDAEELAEETLVQAWRALVGYTAERRRALRLRPWLFQIAANLARNRARSARRNATLSLDAEGDASNAGDAEPSVALAAARIADDDPLGNPEAALAREQQLADLATLLLTLPATQREVVILRHMEGMGFAAIAEVTGEPIGTVKSHASRGVARLRQALERERVAAAQEAI
jgi:RNA polymerase sigma-70 factor (ECF subfamily)